MNRSRLSDLINTEENNCSIEHGVQSVLALYMTALYVWLWISSLKLVVDLNRKKLKQFLIVPHEPIVYCDVCVIVI